MRASRRQTPIVLIATVGISLIQNFCWALKNDCLKIQNKRLEDTLSKLLKGETKLDSIEEELIRKNIRLFLNHAERIMKAGSSEWVLHKNLYRNHHASAELQSIDQYFRARSIDEQPVYVFLLATDTDVSELAARMLREILPEWYPDMLSDKNRIQYRRLEGLQINDSNLLADRGFGELLNYVIEIQNLVKEEKELVINMTAGFKGIIPILSLVAQLIPSKLVYSFEYGPNGKAGPLLEIPPVNLHFLWDFLEAYEPLMDRILREERQRGSIHFDQKEVTLIEEELIPFRICDKEAGQYRVAPLGKLFLKWMTTRTPTAKSVLGFFLEYKFFEYLVEEPWKAFTNVRRSVYLFGKEIDLYLEDPISKQWIWGEVKSYQKLKHAYNKRGKNSFGFQLKKSLEKMEKSGYTRPEAFHLFIYKRSFQILADAYCLKALRGIKSLLNAYGITMLRIFYIDLNLSIHDLSDPNSNPYASKLMQRKFTGDEKTYEQHKTSKKERYELIREFRPEFGELPEFTKPQ